MSIKIVGVLAIRNKENVLGVVQTVCAASVVFTINLMDVTVHLGDLQGMNVFRSQEVLFSI